MSCKPVQRFLVGLLLLVIPSLTAAAERGPRWVWVDPRDGAEEGLSALSAADSRALGLEGFLFPSLSEGIVHHPANLLPGSSPDSPALQKFHRLKGEGAAVGLYYQVFTQGGRIDRPDHLARLRPEWLSYSRSGEPLRRFIDARPKDLPFLDGLFFDPGVPKFTEFFVALLTESLQTLSPEWIVLDQVRYPAVEPFFEGSAIGEQPYGYHPVSRGNFQREFGVDPLALVASTVSTSPGESGGRGEDLKKLQAWNDFRREAVNAFIRTVRDHLSRHHPQTRLAVVGYPEPVYARETLFQDWPHWLRENWVDAVILPAHGAAEESLPDLTVFDPLFREKIWLAGALPPDSSPMDFLAQLEIQHRERGWIFFEDRAAGFTQSVPPPAASEGLHDRLAAALHESDPEPIEVLGGGVVKEGTSPDSAIPAQPSPATKIRALYGFAPDKPPFDQLTSEGAAGKLADLGFNAVFGGSESPEMRAALEAAGILRYAEYPVFVGRTYFDQDPSTRPVGPDGKTIDRQSWYAPLDPHLMWLRDVKREALLDRVREQELDGIWLDFIRFPVFWEEVPPKLIETSFSSSALTAFQEKTGIVPEGETVSEMAAWILANAEEEWRRFRADVILDFIREVDSGLQGVSPDILLGAFVLPWSSEEHGGALYRIAGQDLKGFSEIVDILSPMLYSHQLGRSPGWIGQRTEEVFREVGGPLLPIVQCFDEPTPMPDADVEAAIRAALEGPTGGVILFSQRHLEAAGRWELVRRVLRDSSAPPESAPPLSTP